MSDRSSTKRPRLLSSPPELNSSSISTDVLIKKLNLMENRYNEKLSLLNAEIKLLKSSIVERDQKIIELESKVLFAINSGQSIRRIEIDSNRYKVRIYNFPLDDSDYIINYRKIIDFLESFEIKTASIADIRIINAGKGRQILIKFLSTESSNLLISKSKIIYKEKKIRIARELSQHQRKEMQLAIDRVKEGKNSPKVVVDWAVPAAYVDRVRVWPLKKSLNQRSNYCTSTPQSQPINTYSDNLFTASVASTSALTDQTSVYAQSDDIRSNNEREIPRCVESITTSISLSPIIPPISTNNSQ